MSRACLLCKHYHGWQLKVGRLPKTCNHWPGVQGANTSQQVLTHYCLQETASEAGKHPQPFLWARVKALPAPQHHCSTHLDGRQVVEKEHTRQAAASQVCIRAFPEVLCHAELVAVGGVAVQVDVLSGDNLQQQSGWGWRRRGSTCQHVWRHGLRQLGRFCKHQTQQEIQCCCTPCCSLSPCAPSQFARQQRHTFGHPSPWPSP